MYATPPANARRLRKWNIIVLVLLLAAVVFVGIPADRKYQHASLMKALLKAGAVPTDSDAGLSVRFGRNVRVDREILQSYDYFGDLKFQELDLENAELTESDIEALFRAHPLQVVTAHGVPISAAAISGLKNKPMLRRLHVPGSELTDKALAALPLERIESLRIENTQVTPQGLLALNRCQNLQSLGLDGSQFTEEVAVVLQSFPLQSLVLSGPEVTDEHVQRLQGLTGADVTGKHGRVLCSGCLHISLSRTSVSPDAVASLKAARPTFFINQ